jgi:hypothetical protein
MEHLQEEVIFIFWSKNPSEPSLVCNESAVEELCTDLWGQWLHRAPPKVIFVNAGGIDPKRFDRKSNRLVNDNYEEKENAFRSVFNDVFGLPGPSRGDWQSPDSRVKVPDCTYLSMREYLTTHDWTGEFTAEEVEPWLRDEEKEESK